jgi:hypothetical protein
MVVGSFLWLCIQGQCFLPILNEGCVQHNFCIFFLYQPLTLCGLGSSVGIATGYGLDGPGIESRWGEIFRARPDRPWGPPSLLYDGYRVFPGGKVARAWR